MLAFLLFRLYTRNDFRPYLEQGACDIIQPDVAHAGGISEVVRIGQSSPPVFPSLSENLGNDTDALATLVLLLARMAEAYDVVLAPHCPNGPISLLASLHMDLALPNAIIQEMSCE